MSEPDLLIERDGHVAVVTINRPERMNAMTMGLLDEFEALWPALGSDPEVRAVLLTGAGDRAFCAGADVEGLAELRRDPAEPLRRVTARWNRVYKPVVVAVNGVCAGAGFHFVGDGDIVVASETATFTEPHVSVGQVCALEPIALSRRIPLGTVLRMVVLGRHERIDAARALALGLVSEVLPPDRLMPRARELAHLAASASPQALQLSLKAIWEGLDRGLTDALQEGWEIIKSHWGHPDAAEGPRAFAERREPRWTP